MRMKTTTLALLALTAACNDELSTDEKPTFEGGVSEAGSDAGTDAGETGLPEGCIQPADFVAPAGYPTFAVRNSDYVTASIALLDEAGAVIDDNYLGADSDLDGLPGGLHSDVSLPTTPGQPDVLAVVARKGGDYVLRMDLNEAEVINRIATQTDPFEDGNPDAAWASNPHDYLYVNDTTAFVTRYAPNLDGAAEALDRGNDILVINPKSGKLVERIALDAWDERVDGVDVFARPDTLLGMGCHALFGTSRLSGDLSVGSNNGAVGLLDLRERTVKKVDVSPLANCSYVRPVAGDGARALVECAGSPWGDRGSAGMALLHVDEDGEVEVEHTLLAEKDSDPLLSFASVSLGGARVAVAAPASSAEGNDVVYLANLSTGKRSKLFEATGGYTIGTGEFDPTAGRLYIPDANVGVRVFEEDGDSFSEKDAIEIDPLLPPRTVRALRAL